MLWELFPNVVDERSGSWLNYAPFFFSVSVHDSLKQICNVVEAIRVSPRFGCVDGKCKHHGDCCIA